MKKIFMVASLAAGLTLITGCSVKPTEDNKNSDYNNTIYRGRNTHNFTVIDNKLNKVLENQEHIIKQNKEILEILNAGCSVKLTEDNKNSDYNNTIYRGRKTHNFIVIDNKLNKALENQERIIEQNKEMLEILNKQN